MFKKIKNFLFVNKTAGQTAAKNVFWLSAGQIGSRIFRASVIIYAARALGAEGYGIFSYVLGLAGFFTIFADIGVNPILTRESAKDPKNEESYFATGFWIKMALLLGTMALVIFVAPYFSKIEEAKALLIFVAFLTFFDGLREFEIAFFRARQRMELEAVITTITNIAITAFGFVILFLHPTPQALATTYALSAGTGSLAGIIILRKNFAKIFTFFKKDLVKVVLKAAWPIAIMSIMGVFSLNVDIIMLGYMKTAEDVGFYSAGQKIVQLLYTLPSLLAVSLFPIIAASVGHGNRERTREIMERGVTAMLMVGIPLTVGGAILGRDIITFVYGAEYLPAIPAFMFLILTLFTVFPGTLMGNYILAHDRQKSFAPVVAFASIGNVVFNALLIPKYGAAGSAVATLIVQTVYNVLSWRLAKRVNDFRVLGRLKRTFAATAVMAATTVGLSLAGTHVIATIAVSIAVYFGTLWLLKEQMIREIRSLFA